MPLAKDVAAQLRKVADSLDANPDAEIFKPIMYWNHYEFQKGCKDNFLALAKILPRPLVKSDNYNKTEIILSYDTPALNVHASIPKASTCELVEPAKPAVYRCTPILSEQEESEAAALTEA